MLAVSVCGEQGKFPTTPTGGGGGTGGTSGSDVTPPAVHVILPAPPRDTIQDITDSLKFTVTDTDDVKLKTVQVTVTGIAPYSFNFIDSANPGVIGYTKSYVIPLKRGGWSAGKPGKHVIIAASALDPTGNLGAKTDTILIVDQKAPVVTMSAPAGATTIGAGSTLKVVTSASDVSGVLYQGARLFTLNNLNQRVVLVADSNLYTTAPGSKTDTISVRIPASVAPGSYLLQSFARDSSPTPNDTVSASASVQVITILAPFGSWVFPPQDTAVVAGDNFLASFRAQDSAGVSALSFAAYSVHGDSSLGTFTTSPRFTAIGSAMTAPLSKDTTIRRIFTSVPDSSIDSVFLAATVTNVGGVNSTIRRRIQVIKGPFVQATKPVSGARVPTGVADSVSVTGYSPNGIQKLGFTASGVAAAGDSISYGSPYANTQTSVRFLTVPASTALGVDTIVPFAVSGLGVRFTGKPILVSFADTVKPLDTIQVPAKAPILTVAVGDSVFVQAHVKDNRGVVSLVFTGVAKRGSVLLGTDTVVPRYTPRTVTLPQTTDTVITRYLRAATPLDSTGEFAYLIATASDSSGNVRADTTQIRIVSGPKVTMLSPSDSSVTSPNKIITVSVHAKGTLGVHVLGWRATGDVVKTDSVIASPSGGVLSDTLTFSSNLTIPSGTPVGSISITGFALDSLGNPSAVVTPRTVLVQSTATSDVTPPTVTFAVPLRVEVGDSLTVTATDPGGIRRIGFIVHHLGLNDTIQLARWADTLPGTNTNVIAKFRLNLDTLLVGTAARQVTIDAFADDSVLNHGVTSRDTLTVVAGQTVGLPAGGSIGDAIVNPIENQLYLTNTPLDQLEVFNLGTNSFGSPIPVGAQPVGIALWPKDTLGNNLDSVLVANSGGTNLSVVDVRPGTRAEVSRRRLPNYLVQTVKTQTNAGGGTDIIITQYDLADRPQYLGAVCRKGGSTACDSVIAVYSTAPTGAQASPFTNRGYVAWENLAAPPGQKGAGHYFYEPALGATTQNDTLQLIAVRDTIAGVAIRDTIVGAGAGLIINKENLAFQDSTFVRNSGNFVRSLIGEGGFNQGTARVLAYDATRGVANVSGTTCAVAGVPLMCSAKLDNGVSPSIYVTDFVTNRASPVRSIATNFNGRTNLVRADSVYAFDYLLRQTGLMSTGAGFPGMDFDPTNDFDAATRTSASGTSKNDRLVFAARPDASIDVFDTYWYSRVATVPIRDTVIGPIRVAKSAGILILAGVTSRGVVVIRLPSFTNPLPASPALPPKSVTNGAPVIRATGQKAPIRQ